MIVPGQGSKPGGAMKSALRYIADFWPASPQDCSTASISRRRVAGSCGTASPLVFSGKTIIDKQRLRTIPNNHFLSTRIRKLIHGMDGQYKANYRR